MKLNMAGVKAAAGFEPLPSGTYRFRIIEGEEKPAGPNAKNPGDPLWNLRLEVTKGEQEGRLMFTNISFTEKALPFAKAFLAATGVWSQEELDSNDFECEVEQVINAEVGAKVGIRAATEEYDASNNVKRWMTADEADAAEQGASSGDTSSMLP